MIPSTSLRKAHLVLFCWGPRFLQPSSFSCSINSRRKVWQNSWTDHFITECHIPGMWNYTFFVPRKSFSKCQKWQCEVEVKKFHLVQFETDRSCSRVKIAIFDKDYWTKGEQIIARNGIRMERNQCRSASVFLQIKATLWLKMGFCGCA